MDPGRTTDPTDSPRVEQNRWAAIDLPDNSRPRWKRYWSRYWPLATVLVIIALQVGFIAFVRHDNEWIHQRKEFGSTHPVAYLSGPPWPLRPFGDCNAVSVLLGPNDPQSDFERSRTLFPEASIGRVTSIHEFDKAQRNLPFERNGITWYTDPPEWATRSK